jgi:YegS/Rv2252/BmrU family lipid kinase
MLSKKKALLVINPCAGVDRKRVSPLDIIKKLSAAGFEINVENTKGVGDATTIVNEMGKDFDLVLCCGGDGTLNETINGVLSLDKKIPVGYIPSGSTNDLASTLGIPVGVGPATDLILNGKTNGYDVGSFKGRYFNYIASFGAATDLSYTTPQKWKNLFGHNAYVYYGVGVRMIPLLASFKPTYMKIEYDGGVVEDKFYFGAISNTTSVAGVFKYDNIKLNDGYFELLLVKGLKRNIDVFGILNKVIHKDYSGDNIIFTKTKHVKITCDTEVPWTLDGEFGGNVGDVEIDVIHNAYEIYSDNEDLFVSE